MAKPKKPTILIRRHWPFILVCLAFVITGLFLMNSWFRFYINPDASSYFTLAQKYAHLDIRHAVNGYWGPLISWLLVPAVWLHADLLMAAKVLAILTSLAILITVYTFLLSRRVSRLIATLTSLLLGIILLDASVAQSITPDLLMALLVLLFAINLGRFLTKPTRLQAMVLGIIGGGMYFAKGFGLFLFLAVIGLVALWQWWRVDKELPVVVRRYLPVIIVFAVLVSPFIVALSFKYNKPTINTAGAFDHALYGPVAKGTAYPMLSAGPLVPPPGGAISVWEDPTVLTPLIPASDWNPLSSKGNFKYFVQSVVGRNLNHTISFILSYGPYVAFGMVILLIGGLQQTAYRQEFAVFSLIVGLMIFGYSLVLVESRYLLGGVVLAVVGASLWFAALQKAQLLNRLQIIVGGLVVCAITLLLTLQAIVASHDPYAAQNYQIMMKARPAIPAGSKIISDTFSSYSLCYSFKLQCYSVLTPPSTNTKQYYDLLKHLNIQYFVDFHTRDNNAFQHQFVAEYYTKIDDRAIDASTGHITVYRLN